MLYQLQIHIIEEFSQRAHMTKMHFKLLESEYVEVQKDHMNMKKNK